MQLTHETNTAFIREDLGATTGMHGRMAAGLKVACSGASSASTSPSHQKIDALLLASPLQRIGATAGQTGHAHGLGKPSTTVLSCLTLASRRNTWPSSNTRTRACLRAWLNLDLAPAAASPATRRITLIWLAMGLSSLMGLGLPASHAPRLLPQS